ncbi:MAG TPA: carboxypeptidase-like regulatory domain-containing protein [Candidatus Sulfotelmatobacter sp.]|nr:carboxypeptidase-like regulatory domain-containing protein [Candidatus Sulfotelmatobacter sp.]
MSTISNRIPLIAAIFAVFSLLAAMPTRAVAQDVAAITGVITDASGAVVPDVEVTLSNPETGVSYKAVSTSLGSYTINEVKPGPGYKIEFTRNGFKPLAISGLYLNVAATRTQNAQLTIGEARETIEVSAASQQVTLDTTDATVGNNFQVQVLNDMPVQDRSNPSALFVQQPGVTLDGAVTGARTDQSRVTVDGLDVNDMGTGEFGYIVGRAPVDSVQEFRGVSAGFLPDAAGGGGGQYELVTKSGTNSFHGSLVEYHRDTSLEANDWFNNNSGVPRPPLIRNQFGGSIGGPIIKNKLFFFFTYNGRRDTLSNLEERTVPMDSFRNGTLSYINTSNQLATLTSSQVAGFDPQHVGFNSSLQSLFSSRYPHANDFSGAAGDLINTAGYRFNAPFPYKEDDYVQRVDYNLNDKMKIWGKGNFVRTNGTESAIQFPGDPLTSPFFDRSYTWVVGHVWTLNTRMVNNASFGEVYENFNFPNTYNPTGANQFGSVGGNGTGGSIIDGPYASAINAQGRTYPIPVIRDDFSWDKGNHSFRFGGTFKYITPHDYTILNYNVPTIGLGGNTPDLNTSASPDPLRPLDICPASAPPPNCNPSATGLYDAAFALALAPYSAVSSTFNYDAQGNALAQGSGSQHTYRYYETELYFADTWKIRPNLTMSYGLRWINYSVPYDTHGIQSIQNYDFDTYFNDRVAQSAAGQSGNSVVPFISYSLGGKANHAPGYFKPQYTNFAPRIAVAYAVNPKTVFNAGAGIVYDQTVVNAVQYQQSQFSYLFQASATQPFGAPGDPVKSLKEDARFSGLTNPPAAPPAPSITKPFLPFVDSTGTPFGLANGGAFNEIIDPNLKTPYSIQFNVGFEKQLPAGLILRSSYVGRLGRRLLAQADANQLIDFKDPVSGQLMSDAFANVTRELRAGVDPVSGVTPQPWYENVLYPNTGAFFGLPNNTTVVSALVNTLASRGDFADTTQVLALLNYYYSPFATYPMGLPANIGMGSQFSENTFYTNKGSSNYHGLLTTLHKNVSHGLQFDLNYTWSHSIDNVSIIANQAAFGGYGFVCDVLRPRECRGNSDFDVTHYFNGNFIYDLPVGRGKALAGGAHRWLDEVIGGWSISGLPSWHSGGAYFASSNAFVAGYANDAPAILTGPASDLHIHLNGGKGQPLYGFANPSQANADFVGPIGFNVGGRNNLRGPSYFDMDAGLAKAFPLSSERFALKFRADAFNVFNHPNFSNPCSDITNVSCLFGTISSTVGTSIRNGGPSARVLQLALRLEF